MPPPLPMVTTTYKRVFFIQEGKQIKCISSFTCVFVVHFPFQKICLPYVFESLTVHLWRKVRLPLLLPKVILIFCHLFNTREKRGKRREDGREESPKT